MKMSPQVFVGPEEHLSTDYTQAAMHVLGKAHPSVVRIRHDVKRPGVNPAAGTTFEE